MWPSGPGQGVPARQDLSTAGQVDRKIPRFHAVLPTPSRMTSITGEPHRPARSAHQIRHASMAYAPAPRWPTPSDRRTHWPRHRIRRLAPRESPNAQLGLPEDLTAAVDQYPAAVSDFAKAGVELCQCRDWISLKLPLKSCPLILGPSAHFPHFSRYLRRTISSSSSVRLKQGSAQFFSDAPSIPSPTTDSWSLISTLGNSNERCTWLLHAARSRCLGSVPSRSS